MNKKRMKIGLAVALLCIIFANSVGSLFETLRVENIKDKSISVESAESFLKVDPYPITIKEGQKFIIKFSVYSVNASVSLKIFGEGAYNSERAKNTTNGPQTATGKYFLISTPAWGYSPSTNEDTRTAVTCNQDDFYYIEFMGDGQSLNDIIWNEPGEYVIIVYGMSSFVNDTAVAYNLQIFKSGPSELITDIMSYLGLGIIILVGIVIAVDFRKKWRGA